MYHRGDCTHDLFNHFIFMSFFHAAKPRGRWWRRRSGEMEVGSEGRLGLELEMQIGWGGGRMVGGWAYEFEGRVGLGMVLTHLGVFGIGVGRCK